MIQVNIHEAKTNLSRLIQQVIDGEEVVIAKDHRPVVKLVALASQKPVRRLGSAAGLIQISGDFSEPLPELEDYLL
ncbi:MAG TPA: type II toxin-antitoxin system Phd/YefM family antitoxin [bacterium]|nr:type II toxin-antitoxin system Phd/YefM family antitoxin [bacterium]HPN45041.1 type II toxin-antitoxin system Phd/YefM family antitoxin [bacterium]